MWLSLMKTVCFTLQVQKLSNSLKTVCFRFLFVLTLAKLEVNCLYLLGFVKFLLVVVKVTNFMKSVCFGLFLQMLTNLLKTARFDFL